MLFSMLHQIALFCAPCAKPCSFLRFVKYMSSAKSCYFLCFVARQTCRFFAHQTVQISVFRRTHVAHQTDLLFLRAPNRACSFLCFVVHQTMLFSVLRFFVLHSVPFSPLVLHQLVLFLCFVVHQIVLILPPLLLLLIYI